MLARLKTGACSVVLLCVLTAVQVGAAENTAQEVPPFDPRADQVLKDTQAYMSSLKEMKLHVEGMLDVVSPEEEVFTYTTQVDIAMKRPDKMYVKRVGVMRNQEIFYNGSELVLHSLQHKVYAKADNVPDTIDKMMDYAMAELGLQSPGSDLLYNDMYNGLMSSAVSGAYLGTVIVDGVECHHLAYRGENVDFQLWVEAGEQAKPKRFMIVSKKLPQAPRYQLMVKSLEPATLSDTMFTFVPSGDEKRIRFLTEQEIKQLKKAVKESK